MGEAGGKGRGFERWKLRERIDLRLPLEMVRTKATAMRRKKRGGILSSSLGPRWGCVRVRVRVHGRDTSSSGDEEGLGITEDQGMVTSTHGSERIKRHIVAVQTTCGLHVLPKELIRRPIRLTMYSSMWTLKEDITPPITPTITKTIAQLIRVE